MLTRRLTGFALFTTMVGILFMAGLMMRPANAQQTQGNGFRITPLTVILPTDGEPAEAGEELEFSINVKNITQSPLRANAEFNNFLPRDETGSPQIIIDDTAAPTNYGLKDFFLPIKSFSLDPEEERDIKVKLRVPFNASPGGHYGVVRFTASPESGGDTVALNASVGTIVLVDVAGEIQEDLSLIELSAAKPSEDGDSELGNFFTTGPISVITRLQNNGNTHLQPFGTLSVKNFFGNTIQSFEFNETRGNVLPDSIRRFENRLDNRIFFGRYKIDATVSYGEGGGKIMQQVEYFWVIPWKLILIILAVLVAIIFVVRQLLKRYKQNILKKAAGK
jgi:hypothetical protein